MKISPELAERLREKLARHAMDRLKERTDLNPTIIFKLDRIAEQKTKEGITPGKYYLPLPEGKGYAAFKTVGAKKKKLVLSTILSPHMDPKGERLQLPAGEHLVKAPPVLNHFLRENVKAAGLLYSYVPAKTEKAVLEGGLHSGKSLLQHEDLLALAAKGRGEDPKEFRKGIEDRLKTWRRYSNEGPNAVFHPLDPDLKVGDKHPLKKNEHTLVSIDVDKLMKDEPKTKLFGLELKPWKPNQEAGSRRGYLKPADVEKFMKMDAKKYWSTYNDPDNVGLYAGSVPHVVIKTPSGHVPAKYLKKVAEEEPEIDPSLQAKFDKITAILARRGVYTSTAHRRVTVPKRKLTEEDIDSLGFKKVLLAIPESGQDRFTSYRHPDNNYHIHSHPERWTIHKDEHAALPMLMHHHGRMAATIKGLPHVVTEGIPGLGYYLKNQIAGRGSTADAVDEDLRPETKFMLSHLRNSPTYVPEEQKAASVTTELQPHQQRVVDKMTDEDQRGLIVAHGLGSGKTLTSIAVADALGLPADVVVPASLRANYMKEVQKHTNRPPAMTLKSLQNVARKGGDDLSNPLMIVDEAHRTRNPTKTQNALMKSPAEKRLLLTGSLFYNTPSDVAGPINLVAGRDSLPDKKKDFDARYLKERKEYPGGFLSRLLGGKSRIVSELNPKHKAELEGILHKYVDHYPGSEENFPTRSDQVIKVPMSNEQRHVYNTIIGKAPEWVREKVRLGMPPTKQEAPQLNAFLAGVRQVSNTTAPFTTHGTPSSPKIDKAVQELQDVLAKNPRAKALIYSNYLDAGINPYRERLEKAQIPFGEFTGEMQKNKRDQLVQDYNADKIKALLLSSAGGEGLDLKGTNLIQILEPHWNDEKLKQVIGRGIRYKSHEALPEEERNVLVQRFLATHQKRKLRDYLLMKPSPGNSVDEYLQNLSSDKERLNDQFRALLKTSAEEGEEDHTLRNLGMGAAMAAPWAGAIGQKPLIHANAGTEYKSHARLQKFVRPGDVILSGDPDFTSFKGMISMATGTPKGFHTSAVGRNGQIIQTAPNGGATRQHFSDAFAENTPLHVLRPDLKGKAYEEYLHNLDTHAQVGSTYRRGLAKELQAQKVPYAARLTEQASGGTYDMKGGVAAAGKELFLPKLKSQAQIDTAGAERAAAREAFIAKGGNGQMADAARRVARVSRLPFGISGMSSPYSNKVDKLVSSVCSSIPALSMPKGHAVLPGKLPQDVLPSDYLRSTKMTPVGRYQPVDMPFHEHVLSHGPALARIGVGLAGAGGMYAASKWLEARKRKKQQAAL